MELRERPIKYKSFDGQVKDIDEKGIVIFYGAAFNNVDRSKEVELPDSYNKNLSENFGEIQHYLNHDKNLVPGVLKSITPDNYGLLCESHLLLETEQGKFVYEYYKKSAELGRNVRHSVGEITVKNYQKAGITYNTENFLVEVSTLTTFAMNPGAKTVSLKSMFEDYSIDELMKEEQFYNLLLNCQFKDFDLQKIENLKNHFTALIEKSRETTQDQKPQRINWNEVSNSIKF